nr:hypothetical protein [uncultured Anaeromusa sp.]
MNDNDTLSQAEAQAWLRAKKNAVEKVTSSSVTMENVASLPNDILKVTVLDKKSKLNGTVIECWMQIQVAVQPEKLEAALKEMRGYDEYFFEGTVYLKGGDEKIRTRVWSSKNLYREDRLYYGMPLTIIKRSDDQVVQALCNNKYYEETLKKKDTPIDDLPINVEVKSLGNETIFDITAQKRLRTQTYADGKVLKEVQWNDPATNWVIKRETSVSTANKTAVAECRNIKLGPQNAALFVIPVGYTKCATFAELFTVGNVGTSQSTQTDPLQKATDAALEAAAQRVLDGAIGGLLNF